MKCPHCLENFFEDWKWFTPHILRDEKAEWELKYCYCPTCKKTIIRLGKISIITREVAWKFVEPKTISRLSLSSEVPPEFADDYKEACLVLTDSPKASAALSRRCLQNLLKEKANIKKRNLSNQIKEVIDSKQLPSHLSEGIDAVRNIGNFAAHPIKNESTREIVEVEPGEAEWNLDILEGLFDFYFVQPEILKKKREKLNHKLEDTGKPPMK